MIITLAFVLSGCGGENGQKADLSTGLRIEMEESDPASEVLGPAPDFILTNQDGEEVRLGDLRGKALLFNFIYTHCKTVCPGASARFARIRDQLKATGVLGDQAMLVSISIDPERDTPEILKQYGEKYSAAPSEWLWLTGPRDEIDRVVRHGFFVYYEKMPTDGQGEGDPAADDAGHDGHGAGDPPPPAGYEMDHMNVVVLVDGQGRIRQVYTENRPMTAKDFVRDIRAVLS